MEPLARCCARKCCPRPLSLLRPFPSTPEAFGWQRPPEELPMSLRALSAASPWEVAEPPRGSSLPVVRAGEPEEEEAVRHAEVFAPPVQQALFEGLAHPVGGEVVVRS